MDTYPQQHLPSSMLASDTQLGVGLAASSSVGSSQSVSLLLDYDKKWAYVDSSLAFFQNPLSSQNYPANASATRACC